MTGQSSFQGSEDNKPYSLPSALFSWSLGLCVEAETSYFLDVKSLVIRFTPDSEVF